LTPTYHDDVEMLIHAMFQVLVNSVEEDLWLERRVYYHADEDGHADLDWDGRDSWQEIATLYDWWINVRPAREQAERDALHVWHDEFQKVGGFDRLKMGRSTEENRLNDIYRAREAFALQDDEAMMIRLCKMRNWLWT
jgi:hypothetical protein